jgi:hypothetical protein
MMELYDSKKVKPKYFYRLFESEKTLRLRLVTEDGKVASGGSLLNIRKETGEIFLYKSIFNAYGLKTDSFGRLKLTGNSEDF